MIDTVKEELEYYRVFPSPLLYGERKFGTACAPQDWNCYVIWRGEPVAEGIQLSAFELRYGFCEDYLDNNCGYNLCSQRLMQIVEENKAASDRIEWFPVEIKKEDFTSETYYILHIPVIFNVLDEEKTQFHGANPRILINPYFSGALIKDHSIFGYEWDSIAWVVSAKIKEAIEKINCTGISFIEAKVTKE